MSVIKFVCKDEQKQDIIKGVWDIIKEHYFTSATPNNTIQYKYEGEEIYRERLDELMDDELCFVEETKDGFSIEFDSTEDAGFSIASVVYGTSMGYCDNNLTFVNPIFEKIVEKYKDISFEAECVCCDSWTNIECTFSYDGETLKINDVDYKKYQLFMDKMNLDSFNTSVEEIAKEVGIDLEIACSFLD